MGLEHLETVFAFSVVMLLLSLVITMSVQAFVAALGLRGRNLMWGITRFIERVPGLEQHAKNIAEQVLKHASIVSPLGRRANAIGSEELWAILKDLATKNNSSLSQDEKDALTTELAVLVPRETRDYARKVVDEVKLRFSSDAKKVVDEVWAEVQNETLKLSSELNLWFDTIMNRTTDRFVLYTRACSIVLALILSLGLQLDSLDILKNLSTDSELRAKLVQSADVTISRAQTQLLRKPVAVEALEAITPETDSLKDKEIPQGLATRSQGAAWLQQAIGSAENGSAALAGYENKFDELTRVRLTTLGSEIQELRGDLEKSRLVVLPVSIAEYKKRWADFWGHALGIVISVLLLSLGAPFWFNVLRTVATLRPILAGTTDPSKDDRRKA